MEVKNRNSEKTINPNLSAIIDRLEERGLHALKLRTVLNWFDHVKGKVTNAESKTQNLSKDGEIKTQKKLRSKIKIMKKRLSQNTTLK